MLSVSVEVTTDTDVTALTVVIIDKGRDDGGDNEVDEVVLEHWMLVMTITWCMMKERPSFIINGGSGCESGLGLQQPFRCYIKAGTYGNK
jgi:hypothetical protein